MTFNKYINIIQNWYPIMYSNVFKSFNINLYSIPIFIICLMCMSFNNGEFSFFKYCLIIFNLIICTCFSYFYHYFSHMEISYPLTYGHYYHHKDSKNIFSIIIENLWEISFLLLPIFIKLLLQLEYNIDLWFLDNWYVFLFYFVWASTHQINYSIFHVNTIHEKQHKNVFTNLGPEIADVFFCTKSDDEFEDMLHFIPNIIVGLIIIYFLKQYWIKLDDTMQLNCKYGFIYGFAGLTILSLFINIFLCNEDLQEYLKNDLNSFCNKRENIKEKNK